MKFAIAALAASLGLAGCVAPAPYDPGQVSLGIAQQKAAVDVCFSRAKSGEFTKMRGFTDCMVTAKSQFATTVKLKEPGYLTAYVQRMNLIGDDTDAGKLNLDQAMTRIKDVEVDFGDQLAAAYRENAREQAEASAKMAAFGAAMQNAGAALKADTPQPTFNAPTNCISTVMGGRANGDNRGAVLATNCH